MNIGIDIGGTKCAASLGLSEREGEIKILRREEFKTEGAPTAVLEKIAQKYNHTFNYTDVDMGGYEFSPIGYEPFSARFKGVFDGGNHKIKGLFFGKQVMERLGGNGSLSFTSYNYGVVKNVVMEDVYVYNVGGFITAMLVGVNNGVIENCHVKGTVYGSNYVGGLVGHGGPYEGMDLQAR